jgi:hypothetical protein
MREIRRPNTSARTLVNHVVPHQLVKRASVETLAKRKTGGR